MTCLTCGFHTLNPQQCPLIGYQYAENGNQVCPYWTEELPICGVCGEINPIYALTQKADESWIRICKNCLSKSGTCVMCLKSTTCDFETNPSPIPKAVQKTIQQGPITTVTTVKNIERVRETCQKNCECFRENFGCLRESGNCEKYKGLF